MLLLFTVVIVWLHKFNTTSGTQFCLHADPGTRVPLHTPHTPSAGGPVSTGEERRAGRKQGRGSGTDKPSSSNPTSRHPCCHIPRIQVLLTRLQPVARGSGVFNAWLLPDSRPLDPHDGFTSVWEHGAQILAEKCLSWQVGMLHPKKQKLCSRAVFTGFIKQVLVQKVFSGLWCLGQHGSLRRCVAEGSGFCMNGSRLVGMWPWDRSSWVKSSNPHHDQGCWCVCGWILPLSPARAVSPEVSSPVCRTSPLTVNRDAGVSVIASDRPPSANLPQWVCDSSPEHLFTPFLTAWYVRFCQEPSLIRKKNTLSNNANNNNKQNAFHSSFCVTG